MKKLSMLIIILIMAFSMTSCGERQISEAEKVMTGSEYWYHFDEVTGENEKMSFNEDGSFYWGCECGEPIGDSDCYELFDYDENTAVIKLHNDYDDMTMDMEVLDYSDYHLLLKMDGVIKDYTSAEPDVIGALSIENPGEYIDRYSGEFHSVSGDEDSIILTHFDYDGDVEYPENAFKEYSFSDDAEFYSLNVNTHIIDGEVVNHNEEFMEIDAASAAESMEGGAVFVWFDSNLEISKMLFYGAVVSEE